MLDRLFGRKANSDGPTPNAGAATPDGRAAGGPSSFGLPASVSNSPAYTAAVSHLTRAIRLEADQCDFKRAMEEFDAGLQLLFGILKSLPKDAANESSREVLRTIIHKYMTRAEEVKRKKQLREGTATATATATQRAAALTPRTPSSAFISPALTKGPSSSSSSSSSSLSSPPPMLSPPLDPQLRAAIESEILSAPSNVRFSDVVGLDEAKAALHEIVLLPSLRPDLFSGVRAPPRGLLLYGPPGTGKTLLARAVACESGCTFFSLSAASLMSKHLGEGEKMVRALFQVARERAPSIIFLDEIDSIMTRRSSDEHEASRRLKTEFLIQLDGLSSAAADSPESRVVLLAATNIPEELDDALVRRLPRRIYLPPPSHAARLALLTRLLSQPSVLHRLSSADLSVLADRTDGYSNSDLTALVHDAALAPLRSLTPQQLLTVDSRKLPPITREHFEAAMRQIRPAVTPERLRDYAAWAKKQEAAR